MSDNSTNKANNSHLVWAGLGALASAAFISHQSAYAKKSRAERDHPAAVDEVCRDISELLEHLELSGSSFDESVYVDSVAEYLDDNCDWEVQTWPCTPEGNPDILIGDLLALEFKYNPGKGERDRCVGQCAGYSRAWPTWIILLDTPASRIGQLENLLADKGLDHLAIWDFAIDRD